MAVELIGKAIEIDPQFVVAQYTLGAVHQTSAIAGRRRRSSAPPPSSMRRIPSPTRRSATSSSPRRAASSTRPSRRTPRRSRSGPFSPTRTWGWATPRPPRATWTGRSSAYQKALGFNPLNAKVHVSLGKLYYSEKGLYYESVQAYKKAIELDGSFLDARMGLAEVYEDKGLYQEAIGEYRKVVEADAQEYRRALQPRPRLREGGCQGVDRPLGALYRARRSAPVREGLGRRGQAPPQEAAESAGKEQLGPRSLRPPARS